MEEHIMNILALQGSPRRQGNTQTVLDIVLQAARRAGAETEVVELSRLQNVSGCIECKACKQKPNEPGCALDDDIQNLLGKALESDVVVWATPVFCWSPTWLAKMAMDRFYCMFKYGEDGQVNSLMQGRKMAAVITAAGGADDGADLVEETCRRLAVFSRCDWLGALVAAGVRDPETIRADTDLIERARQFGGQLAS